MQSCPTADLRSEVMQEGTILQSDSLDDEPDVPSELNSRVEAVEANDLMEVSCYSGNSHLLNKLEEKRLELEFKILTSGKNRASPEDDADYDFDVEEVSVDNNVQINRTEEDIEDEATIPAEVVV